MVTRQVNISDHVPEVAHGKAVVVTVVAGSVCKVRDLSDSNVPQPENELLSTSTFSPWAEWILCFVIFSGLLKGCRVPTTSSDLLVEHHLDLPATAIINRKSLRKSTKLKKNSTALASITVVVSLNPCRASRNTCRGLIWLADLPFLFNVVNSGMRQQKKRGNLTFLW